MTGAILLADVGGTNTRVATLRGGRIGKAAHFPTIEFHAAGRAFQDFTARENLDVEGVALAAAGPVVKNRVDLTNAGVTIDAAAIRRALGAAWAFVVNDLAATARALPELKAADLSSLHPGRTAADATRVVVAPGTGLGIGAIKPTGGLWCVIDGEGGHTSGPAPTPGRGGMSWEDLLSGPGLLDLYRRRGGTVSSAAEVTARADRGEARARRVMADWCAWLGQCCADMSLIFGARGGCYVAGGLLPSLGKQFNRAAFRDGYASHRKFKTYLDRIPVWRVTRAEPVLIGLRALVRDRNG